MSIELSEKQSVMLSAIQNYEIYWKNCTPNNELRRREGFPEVTKHDLEFLKDQIHNRDLGTSVALTKTE